MRQQLLNIFNGKKAEAGIACLSLSETRDFHI